MSKVAILAALAIAGSSASRVGMAVPNCSSGTESVRFDMSDTARNFRSGWHLTVSIAGGKCRGVQIDTGSIGFVVGRNAIGPRAVGPLAAGQQEYTSNGLILLGHYYRAAVTFESAGSRAVTVPITI